MQQAKCPSCGDVTRQHRLPDDIERNEDDDARRPKPSKPDSVGYRCGKCGRLYRHPAEN